MVSRRVRFLSGFVLGCIGYLVAMCAAADDQRFQFAIPSQPLASALEALAEQANIQLLLAEKDVKGLTSKEVQGNLTVRQALEELLAGNGLEYAFTAQNTVVVRPGRPRDQGTSINPPAAAATPDPEGKRLQLPPMAVQEGANLDTASEAGTRLGLTVRETPAVVDVLTQAQMQELGAYNTMEAFNRMPGLTSANVPTSPGLVSLRGFSGGAIGMLYDGVRPSTTAFFTRVQDSWFFDRVEVLKGPSSVMYGEGALAGTIDLVPKRAKLGSQETALQAGYGSFGSARLAADTNFPISSTAAVRAVASYSHSDGYVDDSPSDFYGASISLKWRPLERLTVDLAVDYFKDEYDSGYYGTPLVPRDFARDPTDIAKSADGRVIDKAMRDVNFNVTNAVIDSDTEWYRTKVSYEVSKHWSVSNHLDFYHSDRRFIDAEFYSFNSTTNLIDRSTGIVTHDFDYWIDRAVASGDYMLAGLRNRSSVGLEYSDMSFFTKRRFGDTTAVDPYNPDRGQFPVGDNPTIFPSRTNRDATIDNYAVFAEDALNLTKRLLVVLGARYDNIDFDRSDLNVNSGAVTPINRNWSSVTWRAGMVYDLFPKTQLFAEYSTAIVPPGSLLSVAKAQTSFDLSTGQSVEAGVKSTFLDDRVDTTFSVYQITEDDILTRDPNDPTQIVQGGQQSSRGFELAVSAAITSQLRVDANYTALDAKFDKLIEAGGVSREGNTPPRVPEQVGSLFAYYTLTGIPMVLSAGVHHSGRYYTDNANTIQVTDYTTVEAAMTYRLSFGEFTLRGRNLTDELYADYTDISSDMLTIAPPRSVDLTFTTHF